MRPSGFRAGSDRAPRFNINRHFPVDRQGHFSITGLLPFEVELEADGRTVRVNPDRPEVSVTIDLSRPSKEASTRRVVLRVTTPDGANPPSGTIGASVTRRGDRRPTPQLELPLEKGQAALDAPVPGRVAYQLGSMVGYWFTDGGAEVEPGDGEQVIEIPSMPAGAIVGQVLDADGKPIVSGVSASCQSVEAAHWTARPDLDHEGLPGRRAGPLLRLAFAPGGLLCRDRRPRPQPTGGPDGCGLRRVGKPTERVTIRLARDAVGGGRVVGPDGRPLANVPVKLELIHPTPHQELAAADPDRRRRSDLRVRRPEPRARRLSGHRRGGRRIPAGPGGAPARRATGRDPARARARARRPRARRQDRLADSRHLDLRQSRRVDRGKAKLLRGSRKDGRPGAIPVQQPARRLLDAERPERPRSGNCRTRRTPSASTALSRSRSGRPCRAGATWKPMSPGSK